MTYIFSIAKIRKNEYILGDYEYLVIGKIKGEFFRANKNEHFSLQSTAFN
jgi:hypothetical protein